jgi:hypothetical protein
MFPLLSVVIEFINTGEVAQTEVKVFIASSGFMEGINSLYTDTVVATVVVGADGVGADGVGADGVGAVGVGAVVVEV